MHDELKMTRKRKGLEQRTYSIVEGSSPSAIENLCSHIFLYDGRAQIENV